MTCLKCLDTGFVNRASAIVKPPAMSRPAWDFWKRVLSFSDFCDCRAGKDNLLVFRLESNPPECSADDCEAPAVVNLHGEMPLCEAHALAGKE